MRDEKKLPEKVITKRILKRYISRPGKEGGMCVSKQIHLDEQACSAHLLLRATFSP